MSACPILATRHTFPPACAPILSPMGKNANTRHIPRGQQGKRPSAGAHLGMSVVLFCGFGAAFNVVGDSPAAMLAATAFGAAVAAATYALLTGSTSAVPRFAERERYSRRAGLAMGLCSVAAGTFAGCLLAGISPFAAMDAPSPGVPVVELSGSLVQRLSYTLASALATAVFEETLFRGMLFCAIALRLGERGGEKRASSIAAWTSGVVFGLAHVSFAGAAGAEPAAYVLMGAVLKFSSATLFGYAMAAIAARARDLRPAIAIHAVYDAALAMPLAAAGHVVSSWIPTDASAIAAFLVEFAFCAALAFVARFVRPGDRGAL